MVRGGVEWGRASRWEGGAEAGSEVAAEAARLSVAVVLRAAAVITLI